MVDDTKESIYNRLTLGVITTLQKRPGICDIQNAERPALERAAVTAWEQKYSCLLSEDLKMFYLTCNGMSLTWKVKMNDTSIVLGQMTINPLEKLVRIGYASQSIVTRDQKLPSLLDVDIDSEEEENEMELAKPRFDHRSRAFELDDCRGYAKVCYVYRNTKPGIPASHPDIWLLDRSLQWHHLADSFLDYYRLMLVHLGLPQWQLLFTDIGPTPQAQQWCNLYCHERLGVKDDLKDTVPDDATTSSVNQLDIGKVFHGKVDRSKKVGAQQPRNKKAVIPTRNQNLGSGKSSVVASQTSKPRT